MQGTDRGYFINRIQFDDHGNYISNPVRQEVAQFDVG